MERLIDALGLQHPPTTAHVVGSNGKGTVTTMLAAASSAWGLRSGCFVSPHVEEFRERISVDGVQIGQDEVIGFCERVRGSRLPLEPSFFELTFAMALDHFERRGVEFAAIEAGVGARHDATAVLRNVRATAITSIALDHQATLGPTLAAIAADKSAAIRRGAAAVSAAQEPAALAVLAERARDAGVELHVDSAHDPLFGLSTDAPADPVRRRNARVAAATARLLGVDEASLARGLAVAPLPGRGEWFRTGEVEVLLDGAHDPSAASALCERVGSAFVLLFGSLARKQGEATLERLESRAQHVFVTRANCEPIGVAPDRGRVFVERPQEALQAALAACSAGTPLVIAGSLYLAGELRPLLRELSNDAPRDSSDGLPDGYSDGSSPGSIGRAKSTQS